MMRLGSDSSYIDSDADPQIEMQSVRQPGWNKPFDLLIATRHPELR